MKSLDARLAALEKRRPVRFDPEKMPGAIVPYETTLGAFAVLRDLGIMPRDGIADEFQAEWDAAVEVLEAEEEEVRVLNLVGRIVQLEKRHPSRDDVTVYCTVDPTLAEPLVRKRKDWTLIRLPALPANDGTLWDDVQSLLPKGATLVKLVIGVTPDDLWSPDTQAWEPGP